MARAPRVSKESDLRDQALDKFKALNVGKGFSAHDALGGRIRIQHASGLCVEGNEKSLYAIVSGGRAVASDLGMIEAMKQCADMAAPAPVQAAQPKKAGRNNPETPPSKSIGQMKREAAARPTDKINREGE